MTVLNFSESLASNDSPVLRALGKLREANLKVLKESSRFKGWPPWTDGGGVD